MPSRVKGILKGAGSAIKSGARNVRDNLSMESFASDIAKNQFSDASSSVASGGIDRMKKAVSSGASTVKGFASNAKSSMRAASGSDFAEKARRGASAGAGAARRGASAGASAAKQGATSFRGKASSAAQDILDGMASDVTKGQMEGAIKGAMTGGDDTVGGKTSSTARDFLRSSIGDRARSGMDGRAFDYSSSTMNRETLKRAGQRLTDSEYIKSAVAPGMREAFDQAGGRSGMAKRVIGGAAVGGATTGTIGALRGNDFWESSRAGVVGGAGVGLGMQGAAMGRTQSGRELTESMRGQYDIAKGDAARAQAYGDLDNLGWNPNDGGGAEWAERRASQYQGQSFWENMKQTHQEGRSPRGKKTGHYGEKASSARNVNEDPLYQTQDMTGKSDYMQGGVMHGGYTAPMQIGTMHGQSNYMQDGVVHGGYTGPGRNPSDSAPPVKASGAKNVSPTHTQGRRGKNPNISKPVDTLMVMEQEQRKSSSVASRGRRQVN